MAQNSWIVKLLFLFKLRRKKIKKEPIAKKKKHFLAVRITLKVGGNEANLSARSPSVKRRAPVVQKAPKEVKHLSDSLEVKGVQWCYGNPSGDTQQNFIPGGSSPRSKPSPFYIPFLADKVPLSYIFCCTPFTYLVYNFVSLLTTVNTLPFKYEQNTKAGKIFRLFSQP